MQRASSVALTRWARVPLVLQPLLTAAPLIARRGAATIGASRLPRGGAPADASSPSSPRPKRSVPPKAPSSPTSSPVPPPPPTAPSASALLAQLIAPITSMRLDNFLAQNGYSARKDVRKFCKLCEVQQRHPDGHVEPLYSGKVKVDPANIYIDGEPAAPAAGQTLHLALYKPAGYVCTHAEDEGDAVYDLLPRRWLMRKPPLASIGRLDKHATGLLLLSQSGPLQHRLTAPGRGCAKEYVVSLAAPLSADGREAALFASGRLQLVDGHLARPAVLAPHRSLPNVARVTLYEGRHHQLRRMFAAVGHEVTGIHRVGFGGLSLGSLGLTTPGQWTLLTEGQLRTLLAASGGGGSSSEAAEEEHTAAPPPPLPPLQKPTAAAQRAAKARATTAAVVAPGGGAGEAVVEGGDAGAVADGSMGRGRARRGRAAAAAPLTSPSFPRRLSGVDIHFDDDDSDDPEEDEEEADGGRRGRSAGSRRGRVLGALDDDDDDDDNDDDDDGLFDVDVSREEELESAGRWARRGGGSPAPAPRGRSGRGGRSRL